MKTLFIILLLTFVKMLIAGERYVLTHEDWSQPKRVETVLQMSAIKNVLSEMNKSPGNLLVVFYPGGDEGTLWAHELQAWLVSLGLPSSQIELRPGSGGTSVLEMQVELP